MESRSLWERPPGRDALNRVQEHSPTAGAFSHKCDKVKLLFFILSERDRIFPRLFRGYPSRSPLDCHDNSLAHHTLVLP